MYRNGGLGRIARRLRSHDGAVTTTVVGMIAAFAAMCGVAQAATVSVANSDFEASHSLSRSGAVGAWEADAASWSVNGLAGTFEPFNFSAIYSSIPALASRVGFLESGASLYQTLNVIIDTSTSYSLSAMFGHRSDRAQVSGVFGFFAGDPSNIIGSLAVVDPGSGSWSAQSLYLDLAVLAQFAGQQLGIFFQGTGGQLNFDNILVQAFVGEPDNGRVLANPIPGAVWLFGTAVFAGMFGQRRMKKWPAPSNSLADRDFPNHNN